MPPLLLADSLCVRCAQTIARPYRRESNNRLESVCLLLLLLLLFTYFGSVVVGLRDASTQSVLIEDAVLILKCCVLAFAMMRSVVIVRQRFLRKRTQSRELARPASPAGHLGGLGAPPPVATAELGRQKTIMTAPGHGHIPAAAEHDREGYESIELGTIAALPPAATAVTDRDSAVTDATSTTLSLAPGAETAALQSIAASSSLPAERGLIINASRADKPGPAAAAAGGAAGGTSTGASGPIVSV